MFDFTHITESISYPSEANIGVKGPNFGVLFVILVLQG
jgi:hypothetical protein